MEPYEYQPLADILEPDRPVDAGQTLLVEPSTFSPLEGSCPSASALSHEEEHKNKLAEHDDTADGTVDSELSESNDSHGQEEGYNSTREGSDIDEDNGRGFSILFDDPRGPKGRYMIRVLTLFPGQETEDICCEVSHTYISSRLQEPQPEDCQAYEALSYTWGDQKQARTIQLSGKPFEVTVNLEVALRHLRLTDKPRLLWVDAVCIDQRNISERDAQVLRMNLIYEQAYRVLVWLGEESADSAIAMDLLEKLGGKVEDMEFEDKFEWLQDISYVLRPKDPSKLMAFTDLDKTDLKALDNLLRRRAWWSRMWVIQELAYGETVLLICGHRTVSWHTVDSLLSRTDILKLDGAAREKVGGALRTAYFLNSLRDAIWSSRDILGGGVFITPTGIRLRSLLEEYENCQCSDPKDKVFALLGLHGCPKSKNLQVNYSNPVAKVYTQATWDVIYDICEEPQVGRKPSLDVICSAYRSEKRQPGLPSWVPDWSEKRRFAWWPFRYKLRCPYAAGGKGRLGALPPISDVGILAIEGILWHRILDVSDGMTCFKRDLTVQELRHTLQSWEPIGLESMVYPTTEDILDAYWRTLVILNQRKRNGLNQKISRGIGSSF